MNTNELIRLADLFDISGEHESASEIDKIIKQYATEEPGDGLSDETLVSPVQDDASASDIMRHILDSLGDIEEKLDEQGVPVNEDVADKLAATRQIFEKLAQVADSLDKEGAREEAATIDGFLAKYGADIMQGGEGREDPKEYNERVLRESPDLKTQAESIHKELSAYLETPDEDNEANLSDAMKQYQVRWEAEQGMDYQKRNSSKQQIFEKLSSMADRLDATTIDGFLAKYAADYPGHPDAPDGKEVSFLDYRDLANEIFNLVSKRQYEKEGSYEVSIKALERVLDFMKRQKDLPMESKEEAGARESALGPAAEQAMGELSEELKKSESNRKNKLSKVAEEPALPGVVDWKEEGDTEQSKRYDSEYHHKLQVREPKRDQERVDREGRKEHHVETYKSMAATSLSTRYCPEHIGETMGRVGISTYQCPLDGHTYNWETGWTDFEGNQHPGGSIAAQTPDSTGYGIPSRIFDSRESVINRVN